MPTIKTTHAVKKHKANRIIETKAKVKSSRWMWNKKTHGYHKSSQCAPDLFKDWYINTEFISLRQMSFKTAKLLKTIQSI